MSALLSQLVTSATARSGVLVYYGAFVLALLGVLGFVGSVPKLQEQARAEQLINVLRSFEPRKLVAAPNGYLAEAEQLLSFLASARRQTAVGMENQNRAAALAHFRQLLEEGLVLALATPGAEKAEAHSARLLAARIALVEVMSAAESSYYWTLLLSVIAVVSGVFLLLLGINRQRRQGPAKPWQSAEAAELLFEHSPVAIAYSDHRDVVQGVNGAFLRLTGFEAEESVGEHLLQRLANVEHDDVSEAMRSALRDEGHWQGELWLRQKSGEPIASKVLRMTLRDRRGSHSGFLTISSETLLVDDQQRLMLWQAHHDPLTKLPNRITLEERFQRLVYSAENEGIFVSIDIDHFKLVNDSVGAQEADRILADAAIRLAMCTEEGDTLARVGGDTFALVCLTRVPVSRANAFWELISQAFAEPFLVQGRQVFLSLSAGAAVFPRDGTQLAEVMQKADAARSAVKDQGGGNLGFFEQKLNERAQRRFDLQNGLRDALENEELHLELQPIVRIAQADYLGAEALLRWTHSTLGRVSPAEFIPIAEETGLIEEIGLWVVEESHRILDRLTAEGFDHLRLSVNVSAVQLRTPQACDRLLEVVARMPTHRLTIEITESALIDHSSNAKRFLESARQLGCQVALDDFGTGFSALAYLRDFNFDVLKVDKAFIDSLNSPRDLGLVASIVSMGKILGMRVVAEGVEEENQVEQLSRIGCHFAQGYHFSRPVPLEEFLALVALDSVPKSA